MAKPGGATTRAKELIGFGRAAEAEPLLRAAVRRDPADAEAHAVLAEALGWLGRNSEAEAYLREAVRLSPRSATYLRMLGELMLALQRRTDAIAAFEASLDAANHSASAYREYADALQRSNLPEIATGVLERALSRHPWDPDLVNTLSAVLMQAGRSHEAVERLRESVRRSPAHIVAAGQLACCMNYPWGIDPRETADAHRHFGRLAAEEAARSGAIGPPHARLAPGEADRRLRVGFVSADLRQHACSFFFEPLISSLDRKQFETFAYSVAEREDARSAALRKHVAVWKHCVSLDDVALARRIRADRIDILIDLSGLTTGSRIRMFAYRPAPIQMTYLGYPNTTGLAEMDYRIVDSLTDPPGAADTYATERLLRIDPCFLCYGGMPEAQVAPHPPSQAPGSDGSITFGSFNALQKVSDPLLRLWVRVLEANPGSRLVMKYMAIADPAARERLRARFVAAGLQGDRVELLPGTPGYREHLETYGKVDIGLDTYPYNGTTTTCEAMWMGVPVVTLGASPDVHAARVGISLLSAVGLSDLVARDADDYVRIASALARDAARLREYRATLRARMLSSPLCDRAAFGARYGAALRGAWRLWCGGDAARSAP
jgi:predicted O-linked N-acetylglucosamine transferase (SPINDLY family)